MDGGDAVVEFCGALDGVRDACDFCDESFHQVGDFDGVRRNVVGACDADGGAAVGSGEAVLDAGEDDVVEIEEGGFGEFRGGLGQSFYFLPGFREVDGFKVIFEGFSGNGDAFG